MAMFHVDYQMFGEKQPAGLPCECRNYDELIKLLGRCGCSFELVRRTEENGAFGCWGELVTPDKQRAGGVIYLIPE